MNPAIAASRCRACSSRSAKRFAVTLRDVPAVGDSLRDLLAGAAVGCKPHLVRTGKAAKMDAAQIEELCSLVPARVCTQI